MESPLPGVDAHSHRHSLSQRVFTKERQMDFPLMTNQTSMRIYIALDGVLIHEMGSIALNMVMTKWYKSVIITSFRLR